MGGESQTEYVLEGLKASETGSLKRTVWFYRKTVSRGGKRAETSIALGGSRCSGGGPPQDCARSSLKRREKAGCHTIVERKTVRVGSDRILY